MLTAYTLESLNFASTSLKEGLNTLFNILTLHNHLQIRQKLLYRRLFTLSNGQPCPLERSTHPQRSLRRDNLSQLYGASQLPSWLNHLLYQTHTQSLRCIKLVT